MVSKAASPHYLLNIQILRFVAAAMVVSQHLLHEVGDLGIGAINERSVPFNWSAGVDIFFIISGFIMFYLCHDRFARPGEALNFLKRRGIRVVPTYWLFTCLMIVGTYEFASRLATPQLDPAHVLASFFFIPWPNPGGLLHPVLQLGWTLNYEIFFYAAFALALTQKKPTGLAVLIGAFVLLALSNVLVPGGWWALRFWSDPIILEFLLGIGLAYGFLRGWRLPWGAAVACAVLGFALLFVLRVIGWESPQTRVFTAGLPALLICSAFALGPEVDQRSRLAQAGVLLGMASYCLYLSHPFTVNVVGILWGKTSLNSPLLFIAVAAIVSIVVSVAIYLLIEKPTISRLSRLFHARATIKVPAVADIHPVNAG